MLRRLWAFLTGRGETAAPSPLSNLRRRVDELEDEEEDSLPDPVLRPSIDELFGVADYLIHDDRYDRPDDNSFWN